jgi:general nucleoside transport system permease protein
VKRLNRVTSTSLAIIASLAVAAGLMLLVSAPPLDAFRLLVEGSVGSSRKLADTLMVWVPLMLTSAGLVVTYTAGLWNIGVEGQVIAGAVAASWVARSVDAPVWVLVILTILAGAIGGMLWALLAGVLKVYGRVNEIFGGLGLTFVAQALTTYLIIGPWKRAGIASTSGTDPFPDRSWMPTLGNSRLSLVAVFVAIAAILFVYFLLRGTRYGLRLKAVGKNRKSAFLVGIPTTRYMLSAFAIGGALAGIAGTVQVTGFLHRLVPAVSGGYGYLGILVALLVDLHALWVPPVAFFFSMISVGSTQLQLRLNLDSSLGGVLQGILVLFTLLAQGLQERRTELAAKEP